MPTVISRRSSVANFPLLPPVIAAALRSVPVCLLIVLGGSPTWAAAIREVDTLAALQSAIHAAAPGDTIVLKNGTYTTASQISVRRAGTAEQPITLRSETPGGAEITGTHGFLITAPAAHVIISGFTFTHAAGQATIGAGTSHIRFTRNAFRCSGEGAYLTVSGDDAQIDYNRFSEKTSSGSMLAVGGTGNQVARRLWIHHNHFHDLSGTGTAGAEMLRYGLSALSLSTAAGIVEHNLFQSCRGEAELISSRASGITYRYNTFLDSPTAQVTLRHGNDCLFYGNILRQTEGLRIFGDRHVVHSNYLQENYIGINLGNGSTEIAEGGQPTGHDRPDHCTLVFNTLVNNRTHYQLSRRAGEALGATRTTFAHNLLQGGEVGAKIEGPYAEGVWLGNLLWKVASVGDLPPGSFQTLDPQLTPDPSGLHRPGNSSPILAAVDAGFPQVTVDLDGQPRPPRLAIGADDVGEAPAASRLLTETDVGPNATVFSPPAPTP